ncbi:MAG: hypothetical protein RBS43_00970 [Candidatus Cloacimonas sp.]|jgi:hypothetical protein|nr:hypothetical protein [Candidatus Cloacimonas sp.]
MIKLFIVFSILWFRIYDNAYSATSKADDRGGNLPDCHSFAESYIANSLAVSTIQEIGSPEIGKPMLAY